MAATQIVERQIADGAITNAKVKAGAAIATSKLADGSNFIKKDGSVVMTGSLDAGNQPILNVGTPSNTTDAATKSYVDSLIAGLNSLFKNKGSVKAATIAAGTLASSFANGSTIDGISLSTGDRILIKDQAAPAENGIYIVAASGAPTRDTTMDSWAEVPGALVVVEQGSAPNADTVWLCTSNQGGTLNTTAITWQNINSASGLVSSNFVDDETPSGSVNGSNAAFSLANTPTSGSVVVFLNGLRQKVGGGNDYTISGTTITFNTAPLTGDVITVDYRK